MVHNYYDSAIQVVILIKILPHSARGTHLYMVGGNIEIPTFSTGSCQSVRGLPPLSGTHKYAKLKIIRINTYQMKYFAFLGILVIFSDFPDFSDFSDFSIFI